MLDGRRNAISGIAQDSDVTAYRAYSAAVELLSAGSPRRLARTKGVAAAAGRLARVLAPRHVNDIVAAAWLHDIGYAPALADTGFHPVDGARYANGVGFCPNVVSLIAHHSGAVIEARQRGLDQQLAAFGFPVDEVELAILNCADLCAGPRGEPVDPGERIAGILHRYPASDPVHRAILTSSSRLKPEDSSSGCAAVSPAGLRCAVGDGPSTFEPSSSVSLAEAPTPAFGQSASLLTFPDSGRRRDLGISPGDSVVANTVADGTDNPGRASPRPEGRGLRATYSLVTEWADMARLTNSRPVDLRGPLRVAPDLDSPESAGEPFLRPKTPGRLAGRAVRAAGEPTTGKGV